MLQTVLLKKGLVMLAGSVAFVALTAAASIKTTHENKQRLPEKRRELPKGNEKEEENG